MNYFNEYLAAKTELDVRSGSLSHLVSGEYPDTDIEYSLLIGLLVNANEVSVKELKIEEKTQKPIGGQTEKTTKRGWIERLLFDPEGPTIED